MKILNYALCLLSTLCVSKTIACEYYMHERANLMSQFANTKIFSREKTFPVNSAGKIPSVARNKIYITIDDGPYGAATPAVLDVLNRYGVKATFFMVGKQAENNQRIVRQVYEDGHAIGSHTYEHGLDYPDAAAFLNSLLKTHRQIIPYQSSEHGLLFRAPGGVWNDWRTTIANNNSTLNEYVGAIYWNVGGGDMENKSEDDADWRCWSSKLKVTPEKCAKSYLTQIRNNYSRRKTASIILMHDINVKSAKMLEIILADLIRDRSVDWDFDLVEEIPEVKALF